MITLSVVISVRVPKWVKERLESFGVDIKDLVKKTLLKEAERLEMDSLAKRLDRLAEKVKKKVDIYELCRLIDEERRKR